MTKLPIEGGRGYDRTILTIREGQKARVTGDCMPSEETRKH